MTIQSLPRTFEDKLKKYFETHLVASYVFGCFGEESRFCRLNLLCQVLNSLLLSGCQLLQLTDGFFGLEGDINFCCIIKYMAYRLGNLLNSGLGGLTAGNNRFTNLSDIYCRCCDSIQICLDRFYIVGRGSVDD